MDTNAFVRIDLKELIVKTNEKVRIVEILFICILTGTFNLSKICTDLTRFYLNSKHYTVSLLYIYI